MVQVGRYTVLAAATVASLSCGLNYCFSAYAPQLGTRLHLTSTQLNTVGAAGNLGVYLSYLIIRAFYTTAALDDDGGSGSGSDGQGWYAVAGLPGLVAAQLLTGMGSTAGLSSVGNSVAKSFRKRRAAALSVVLSGFGLSAFFYSTIASIFLHPTSPPPHPQSSPRPLSSARPLEPRIDSSDPTSAFLLLLALGSLLSMLVGLVFVRPVPLPVMQSSPALEAVKTTSSSSADLDARSAQDEGTVVATERDPLLPPQRPSRRVAPTETPAPAEAAAPPSPPAERNITGWALFRELDFYLIFLFNGLCAGVDINNLGTIVRSLSLPLAIPTDRVAQHQSRLVSLLSIFNFLGRLLSGFGSDWLLHGRTRGGTKRTSPSTDGSTIPDAPPSSSPSLAPVRRRSIPRVVFLPLTSLLFLISQLSLLPLTSPARLYLPTALTGLAHGCLFGISGIIGLERFGIKSFSQTNGVLALAPAFFGQTTNLIFGRIYDSHLSPSSTLLTWPPTQHVLAAMPSGQQQCTAGRACYVQATYLTCAMAALATLVGLGLAVGRKEMRRRAA
ncbi:hypothetical protein BMF94_3332 [Rhodotorula taiwanensis]|uniref:Nodulin-like domain-containing protein n=1 Tax=Rhodotorula taiwanensis TaxID=741276 RepID=A0A2S5BAN8_9BASI|nr:hypothetical protein BMF94_3332 [Rhodotorula taiwanensis]